MLDWSRSSNSHAPLELTFFNQGQRSVSREAAAKAAPVAPLLALPAPPVESAQESAQPSVLETKPELPAIDKGVTDDKATDTPVVVPTSAPGTTETHMALEAGGQVELPKEGVVKIERAPAEGGPEKVPPQTAIARLQDALVKRQDGSRSEDPAATQNSKMKRPASASVQKKQGPPMKKPASVQKNQGPPMKRPASKKPHKAEEKDVIPEGKGRPIPSKSKRVKMMPTGCSTCRFVSGCTPSCWKKKNWVEL